ncbi:lamin tail domain-containing protein, partial [Candidatus Bipolaricaulota bacterium]|nr:lamin tail domain-containing protein [Candidatus Bipolaricaulota bacterium]
MWRQPVRQLLIVGALAALVFAGGCFLSNASPIVVFSLSVADGESPLSIAFDASGSTDPDGAVVSYEWDFGDGTTGTGRSTVHVYVVATETVFSIRLTLTDDDGNRSSASQIVTVRPAPPAPETTRVEFVWPFHYDADGDDAVNLTDEYFALQNTGSQPIDLSGWTVSNERGAVFRFPAGFTLALGAVVTIHSGTGTNSASILYWHAGAPVWSDTSDIAVLRDASGLIID